YHSYSPTPERPAPVLCPPLCRPAGRRLLEDVGNLQVGHRPVGAVLQSQHLPAGVLGPHRADEIHHAAPLRTDYLVRHGAHIERSLLEVAHRHPPASGGSTATSSPSSSAVSSCAWTRLRATIGDDGSCDPPARSRRLSSTVRTVAGAP